MPLPTETKRETAVQIVLAEERARGWAPELAGSWSKEREYGCDLLSTPPTHAEPDRVEVKGWGEPLLTPKGTFTYGQDIRVSQYEAAMAHSNYRIEIVANLDAYLRGEGGYDRLTLTSEYIRAHAVPRGYDIPLDGLQDWAKRVEAGERRDFASAEDPGPRSADAILEDKSLTPREKIDALRHLAESGDQEATRAYEYATRQEAFGERITMREGHIRIERLSRLKQAERIAVYDTSMTDEEALEEIKRLAKEEEEAGGNPDRILEYGETVEMSRLAREGKREPPPSD